jgi:Tol biopolymer transport system component
MSLRIATSYIILSGLFLPAAGAQQSPGDLEFLSGTWANVKDGFSFSVQIEPILGGLGYSSSVILDENNQEVSRAIYAFDAQEDLWTRTQFNQAGQVASFVGAPSDDGIALDMVSFGGRSFDPVRARILLVPTDEGEFVMDWQSRPDAASAWEPREVPFVHRRVDRPAPPSGEGRIAFISKRSGDWEVYTMAPDGTDVVNLSKHPQGDHIPKWIAGGTRIAFRSQRDAEGDGWNRWEIDIDGTDANRVALPEGLGTQDAGMFPEVHPGGSYLVYAVERDGELDMWASRFDGGGERPLAHAPGPDYRPRWSPDGTQVLFISERDGNPEVYRVGFDGAGLTRLTNSPGNDRYARWSPDGRQIVFASDRDTGDSLELYVMGSDGADIRRLTFNDAEDGEPSWSPDGSRIVFRSNASGNAEVCVVHLATGEVTNLTNDPGYDGEPAWSPPAP